MWAMQCTSHIAWIASLVSSSPAAVTNPAFDTNRSIGPWASRVDSTISRIAASSRTSSDTAVPPMSAATRSASPPFRSETTT
jgi:hypothetical protein